MHSVVTVTTAACARALTLHACNAELACTEVLTKQFLVLQCAKAGDLMQCLCHGDLLNSERLTSLFRLW